MQLGIHELIQEINALLLKTSSAIHQTRPEAVRPLLAKPTAILFDRGDPSPLTLLLPTQPGDCLQSSCSSKPEDEFLTNKSNSNSV
jgi:hypothetical protein